MKISKITWFIFAFFAISIGIYPVLYALVDMSQGLLGNKPPEVLSNSLWSLFFYLHIGFGGVSLLTGWSQFSKKIRARNIQLHRTLGKIYMIAVLVSGISSVFIAFYATGGIGPSFGFGILGVLWLLTSAIAYIAVRKKHIPQHKVWMIQSYALTFAAVTLRLWLPFMGAVLHMEFIDSYRVVAWLCWVPNLLIAFAIIKIKYPKVSWFVLS
ncbi:MAG: DUF2306 domain-containing protein [Cyclobacteriaceae bacterium]|nr:DUF2306 domain-containing protein [Cyclobacteriaceae bacterium]